MQEGSAKVEQRLLDVLKEAIEHELLAQRRYALGASLATDPAVKEMFLQLAEEEMGHERKLREKQRDLEAKVE